MDNPDTMPLVVNPREAFQSISVVIPAYNAEAVACRTLDATQDYLERIGLDYEIILVDDGSRDDTASRVARRGGVKVLRNERNRGKGHAVRRGMLEARGAWAMFMDVDNAMPISHLDRFAPLAAEADVLIASRRVEGSLAVQPQPWVRGLLGNAFPRLVRMLALPHVGDSQCGFKVFRGDVAKRLFARQRTTGFCFDVEILLVARRLEYRIVEVPVACDNPSASTLRLGVDPVKMLLDLPRIVWRHRPAKYARPRPGRP